MKYKCIHLTSICRVRITQHAEVAVAQILERMHRASQPQFGNTWNASRLNTAIQIHPWYGNEPRLKTAQEIHESNTTAKENTYRQNTAHKLIQANTTFMTRKEECIYLAQGCTFIKKHRKNCECCPGHSLTALLCSTLLYSALLCSKLKSKSLSL